MSTKIFGKFHGENGPLFSLYMKTGFLTLVTLGIYRFWAKTRLRQFIWSATSADEDSFEYTGTGLEKFLGFLIAVVVLAIYLGIFQMILFFFGIYLFQEPETEAEIIAQFVGVYLTIFAVLPFVYFAQYRARRYKLSRTRWRGLRFGMEPAALGYVWRAMMYLVLAILTLGILLPLMSFRLEKYMTDRTWYGDGRFTQNGKWTALYPGMKHLVIGLVILIAGFAIGLSMDMPGLTALCTFVGYAWLMIGFVSYTVYAFNYTTNNKILDEQVTFETEVKTSNIVAAYLMGTLAIIGLSVVMFGALALVFAAMAGTSRVVIGDSPDAMLQVVGSGFGLATAVIIALAYVAAVLVIGGVSMVLITKTIIAHYVQSITLINAGHLTTIRQRAADSGADADGFADALDIGGAI